MLARELAAALRIPAVGVLGNHDYESGQQEEVVQILREAGVVILDGDGVRGRGHRDRGREGARRRLRGAGASALGRGHHEALRPGDGRRGAQARIRAGPAPDAAARGGPALLADSGDGGGGAARAIPVPGVQPARGAAEPLRGERRSSTVTRIADGPKAGRAPVCPCTTCACRCCASSIPIGRRSGSSSWPPSRPRPRPRTEPRRPEPRKPGTQDFRVRSSRPEPHRHVRTAGELAGEPTGLELSTSVPPPTSSK